MNELQFVQIQKDHPNHITIQISEYLTHELAEKIAAFRWHSAEPKMVNAVRRSTYEGKYFSDCFTVIATNSNNDVIGHLFCLKNQENPKRWYYGDLAVDPAYRRLKTASKMVTTAIQRMSDMGGETLCCYVEPSNMASINLQKSLGFKEKAYERFNDLINDGQLMFEKNIQQMYNAIPATVNEAVFVAMLYGDNRDALHGNYISLNEWKDVLSMADADEKNFLICRGAIPCAWLRINGLDNKDMAWVSMLAVSDKYKNQGIGTYAVRFAEEYIKAKGINKVGIHTTEDNVVAQGLYKKCGYTITGYGDCTTGDGVVRKGYTFVKEL